MGIVGVPRYMIVLVLYTLAFWPFASMYFSCRPSDPDDGVGPLWELGLPLRLAGQHRRTPLGQAADGSRQLAQAPVLSEHDLAMVRTFPQVFRLSEMQDFEALDRSPAELMRHYIDAGPQFSRFRSFQDNSTNAYVSMGPFIAMKALAASLLHAGVRAEFVVMIPRDQPGYEPAEYEWLDQVGAKVQWIEPVLVPESIHDQQITWEGSKQRSWIIAYSKFGVWTLTQYRKAIFIDADSIVLDNIDDLFYLPEMTAASDALYGACDFMYLDLDSYRVLDSGLMVVSPSIDTYNALVSMLALKDGEWPWEGGDQQVIETHFLGRWSRLPQSYNYYPYFCKCRNPDEMGDKADIPLLKDAHVIQYTYNYYKPWQETEVPSLHCEKVQWRLWRWFAGSDRRVGFAGNHEGAMLT